MDRTRRPLGLALLALLALPATAPAQKLDKDDKNWLDDVRPILMSDEEKTFKDLKDKSDRLEFQKIFWARRDPDLATPANEYEAEFRKDRAAADAQFRVPTQMGSATDCGRVFILLGKPDEVQKQDGASITQRVPEVWTYNSQPGRTFTGGRIQIAFDQDCRGTSSLASQLDRLAATKILHPNIDYRKGKDGHIVKLADQLPKDTKARALFKAPRQDFPVAAQVVYLKVADGSTAVLGLVRGEAAGLPTVDAGGAKAVNVSIAASAEGEDGREAGWVEQTTNAPIGADGGFIGSFKMGLKPGRYTLKAGTVDLKGEKASLTSIPIDVPDLSKEESAADGTTRPVPSAALILLNDVQDIPAGAAADPAHPYGAFALGPARLIPHFGTVFHKADQLAIFYQVYDLAGDAAGQGADASATIAILRDGKTPVARTSNPITTTVGGSVIGPVPLAGYDAGKYVVQLKVTDKKTQKEVAREAAFEVVP
jgi:GWxTD domain-containing protein